MECLVINISRKSCTFLLKVAHPFDTMITVYRLLKEAIIDIDHLQLKAEARREGNLVIRCKIEPGRIRTVSKMLAETEDVKVVDWVEGK